MSEAPPPRQGRDIRKVSMIPIPWEDAGRERSAAQKDTKLLGFFDYGSPVSEAPTTIWPRIEVWISQKYG